MIFPTFVFLEIRESFHLKKIGCYRKTRFQLMVPLQAQDVTKYQAGHGKHTEGRKLVAIKRTPQNGLFSVSGSVPDFGRPWTPHR